MSARQIDTRHVSKPAEIIEALEKAGIQPIPDPRGLTRRLADLALEHMFQDSEAADCSDDLSVAARLVATIATINGPAEEQKH